MHIHIHVFTLTHTWAKTSYEALALGCSLLPPLSWPSEHVASGARRGTFLLIPLLCTSLQGPEPERPRWEWAQAAARGTSSGAGGRPGLESPPSPLGRPGPGATRRIPEFSAAFVLFVAYWHSSCNKHPELTAFFSSSFWLVPLRP